MVKQKRARQTGWQLYMLALLMIGLLFLAHRVAPSSGWRTFLEAGVVIAGYGLITVWLETHPAVLLLQPVAEDDNPAAKPAQLESASALSPQLRYQFYAGSDPVLICGGTEQPTHNLQLLERRPVAESMPLLPEVAAHHA